MKNEKFTEAGRMLLRFLHQEAKNKGITQEQIAERSGFIKSNVNRMLNYRYSPTLENFLILAESIGVRIELHSETDATFSPTRNIETPVFMFVPNEKNKELYILHTKTPACLIKVVQTLPATFLITDLFEKLDPETENVLINKAKTFYFEHAAGFDKN